VAIRGHFQLCLDEVQLLTDQGSGIKGVGFSSPGEGEGGGGKTVQNCIDDMKSGLSPGEADAGPFFGPPGPRPAGPGSAPGRRAGRAPWCAGRAPGTSWPGGPSSCLHVDTNTSCTSCTSCTIAQVSARQGSSLREKRLGRIALIVEIRRFQGREKRTREHGPGGTVQGARLRVSEGESGGPV